VLGGRRLEAVFVGPHGVRAGWRFLLFFTIALICAQALDAVVKQAAGYQERPGEWSAAGLLVDAALTVAAVVAGTAVMGRLERRSFAAYGLPFRAGWGARFGEGVLWGLAASSLVLLAIWLGGGAALRGVEAGPGRVRGLLLWALTMLCLGLAEELLYRGYALFTFATGMGFWPAAVLLSLLFGAAHLAKPDESALDIAAIVGFGLFLCLTLRRTGSLWFAIGFHAMWNYAAMVLYAAPNTGNGGRSVPGHLLDVAYTGPAWLTGGVCGMEASVFTFAALAAMSALFARRPPPASAAPAS
jgi:membrane protease YdiL (CAAX protease family)